MGLTPDHCPFVCGASREMHETWKVSVGGVLQIDLSVAQRSPGWNLVRAKHSEICIYAFAEKRKTRKVSKLVVNTCELHEKRTFTVVSLREDEYSRSDVIKEMDILP
ncbi:hypothetical protein PHMEG_0003411 [Phytophthora megakarya]|uniref:Uncharacterized protein n=1 Tax=Phytophthora megakarya TaxID=4795 RepID=A0A225WWB9_9STRA|nr:hypothetical protein PHMEG_0003411 [Phytophthora megakarya]